MSANKFRFATSVSLLRFELSLKLFPLVIFLLVHFSTFIPLLLEFCGPLQHSYMRQTILIREKHRHNFYTKSKKKTHRTLAYHDSPVLVTHIRKEESSGTITDRTRSYLNTGIIPIPKFKSVYMYI